MVALNNLIFVATMRLKTELFNIQSSQDFQKVALAVFKYQFEHNTIYRSFCDLLYIHPSDVHSVEEIPFLPIQFFKSHTVITKSDPIDITFSSSGTSGDVTSKHHVTELSIYEKSFRKGFDNFYGNIEEYTVLALLPSYLEREGSSLIYMVDDLIKHSKKPNSGFYLNNHEELHNLLIKLDTKGEKTLLIGVSFALLDLVEKYSFSLQNTIIMETGGMKGRRKELIRSQLHTLLSKGFGVDYIHSEYGMTELLSQAYSKGDGVFECPPWMQILMRDTGDPLTILTHEKTGGINVIDLANINSCSFIATQDLGKTFADGTFEILGRFDNSDIRGCNLMVY
jgi:hypothetical protein